MTGRNDFPRCPRRTPDGRRCFRAPGHAGHACLVRPAGLTPEDSRRVLRVLREARPDVSAASIAAALAIEVLT